MKACRQINHQPVVVGSPISAEISIRSDAILIHVSRDPLRRSRDCRNRPVLRIEAFQPFFFAPHLKILGPERCKTEFIFYLESFFRVATCCLAARYLNPAERQSEVEKKKKIR